MIRQTHMKTGKGFAAALPLLTALAPLGVSLGQHLLNKYKSKPKEKSAGRVIKRIKQMRKKAGMCSGKFN